nr:potassium transporter [Tanacetum cinerariifolium]
GKDKARHKFSFRRQSHPDLFRDISHVFESDTSFKGKDVDDMKNHVMPAEIPVSHAHT